MRKMIVMMSFLVAILTTANASIEPINESNYCKEAKEQKVIGDEDVFKRSFTQMTMKKAVMNNDEKAVKELVKIHSDYKHSVNQILDQLNSIHTIIVPTIKNYRENMAKAPVVDKDKMVLVEKELKSEAEKLEKSYKKLNSKTLKKVPTENFLDAIKDSYFFFSISKQYTMSYQAKNYLNGQEWINDSTEAFMIFWALKTGKPIIFNSKNEELKGHEYLIFLATQFVNDFMASDKIKDADSDSFIYLVLNSAKITHPEISREEVVSYINYKRKIKENIMDTLNSETNNMFDFENGGFPIMLITDLKPYLLGHFTANMNISENEYDQLLNKNPKGFYILSYLSLKFMDKNNKYRDDNKKYADIDNPVFASDKTFFSSCFKK